jgi:hypothetical protein
MTVVTAVTVLLVGRGACRVRTVPMGRLTRGLGLGRPALPPEEVNATPVRQLDKWDTGRDASKATVVRVGGEPLP